MRFLPSLSGAVRLLDERVTALVPPPAGIPEGAPHALCKDQTQSHFQSQSSPGIQTCPAMNEPTTSMPTGDLVSRHAQSHDQQQIICHQVLRHAQSKSSNVLPQPSSRCSGMFHYDHHLVLTHA